MATKKKAGAQVITLHPELMIEKPKKAKKVVLKYRVDRASVPAHHIAIIEAGRIDEGATTMNAERFKALMEVLSAVRCEVFDLDAEIYTGSDCAHVRAGLQVLKPSELVRIMRGAGLDEYWKTRQPNFRQCIDNATRFLALAKKPPVGNPDRKGALMAEWGVYAAILGDTAPLEAQAAFRAIVPPTRADFADDIHARVDAARRICEAHDLLETE